MKHVMKWLLILVFMNSSFVLAKDWTGALFPSFKLQNQKGDWVEQSAFKDTWTVYYFYPKDHTPGCSIEAENFSKNYQKMKAMGLDVVGISLDDVESHASFAKTYEVEFHLLADTEKQLSKQLDLVNYLPWPHSRRETFIVDVNGNIVKHYQKVSPSTHVDEVIADYQALKSSLK